MSYYPFHTLSIEKNQIWNPFYKTVEAQIINQSELVCKVRYIHYDYTTQNTVMRCRSKHASESLNVEGHCQEQAEPMEITEQAPN